MSAAKPHIFVSHSHNDDTFTERLVDDLNRAGVSAWMDKRDLGAGNFQERISEALDGCEWFVLVLTRDALASGWVRQEVDAANRLKHQKRIRDLIFIQAGPVEHREIPALWGVFNIFDATTDYPAVLARTLKAVGLAPLPPTAVSPQPPAPSPTVVTSSTGISYATSDAQYFYPLNTGPRTPAIPPQRFPAWLATLGYETHARNGVEWIVPPLCAVPAGPFRLGSDQRRDKEALDSELQRREVRLAAYAIARFPVTVAEYACFLTATRRTPPQQSIFNKLTWDEQLQRLEHPVVAVAWGDACDYAVWLAERTGQSWRLPTEAEWEKAARSDPRDPLGASSERIYPWGDSFDAMRCNTIESGQRSTTPVGWYGPNDPDPRAGRRSGASPCGAEDLAGNVWEWTASVYVADYSNSELFSRRESTEHRTLRGGSWGNSPGVARAAYRSIDRRDDLGNGSVGFRVARAALAHLLPPPPPEMVLW